MLKIFCNKPIIDKIFEEFDKDKINQDKNKLLNLVERLPPEDINNKNSKGQTTLILACWYGYTEIVKLLIDAQADVNIQKNDGWTALMLVSRNSNIDSNIETVKLLIDAQTDINIQSNSGFTALMLASRNSNTESNIETVKLLIDAQADPNIQNNDDWTALMLSSEYIDTDSNTETVKLLIDSNAYIDNCHNIKKLIPHIKHINIKNMDYLFNKVDISIDYILKNMFVCYFDINSLPSYHNKTFTFLCLYIAHKNILGHIHQHINYARNVIKYKEDSIVHLIVSYKNDYNLLDNKRLSDIENRLMDFFGIPDINPEHDILDEYLEN